MSTPQVTTYQNYIWGRWTASTSGNTYPITNPVDFFSEVITVYIDHGAAPRQQARFI